MTNLESSDQTPIVIARILTQAFTGDPFFNWLFPDQQHQNKLQKWWAFLTHFGSTNPEWVLAVDEMQSSASIWSKPKFNQVKTNEDSGEDDFRKLMETLVGNRLDSVFAVFQEVNSHIPDEPHWYLQAVGTRPEMQGRSKASELLRPVLSNCDETGIGAYLESTNPRNLSFYYRLGFTIRKELLMDGGQAALTCMWRPPQDPATS
tara:strand:+ start:342 stop:956 length:615 start_codon:yes stop_codon:yes gene_type:complete